MRAHTCVRLASSLLVLTGLLATPAAAQPPEPAFAVEVDDFFFAPDEIFVNAGDTVTWTWVGQAPHNVTPVEEGAFEASPTQTRAPTR
jgi:plastocyanin